MKSTLDKVNLFKNCAETTAGACYNRMSHSV